MSPDTNTRTDEYGGNLEGRLRIVKEIREEIQKRVGDALAVSFRISADQKYAGFRTLEEGIEICKMVESYGYDALNIDAGRYESIDWIFPTEYLGVACMADLANAVKANVNIPVIAVGNYNYPDLAEDSLNNNDADFIALGRSLLADPQWANKSRFGKEEEIRPCLRCNEKCIMNVLIGKELTCSVNPQCGRESRFKLIKAEKPRRVTVIGGGPAGMEAAVIAAERGHKVTLLEKNDRLGGQLNYADLEPFKWSIADFNRYLKKQVERKGVDIKFNIKADIDAIKATSPDAVVVATGADVFVPKPFANAGVLTVADLPSATFKDKENIVVIGGGLVGCETALGLAMKGHEVTLLEMRDGIAMDMNMINKVSLLNELNKYKVNIITGLTCSDISDGKITGTYKDGKTAKFSYDKVITATGTRKVNEINDAVEKEFPETYVIGDCASIGKIADSIHKGYITGTQI